ncbi:hypothetical protein K474DRAFT_1768752 [Panus rudis PR-1116 ss-1]|nr:hypothetical protein K474DRAFT_1768752 [Panus rudis PR-1116 ss-1]
MGEYNLTFSESPAADIRSFRLLELPSDLCKAIESSTGRSISWAIKGESADDAVLCTANKTYTLRSVVLSNSVLVTSASNQADAVVIRDTLHEIYELVPSVPRLQKLNGFLRGAEYNEGQEAQDMDGDSNDSDRETTRKGKRLTYQHAREILQASDAELDDGLRKRRILVLNGELRPIAPSYLTTIIELLLNYLVSLSLPSNAAPVDRLTSALHEEHEVRKDISRQVMAWFGEIEGDIWRLDAKAAVKEVGVGILRAYKDDPLPEAEFVQKWKAAIGDTYETHATLALLSGNYLLGPAPNSLSTNPVVTYFPSSALPTDPAARFTDLFLTRPRWKADEITPFLEDIVVDKKERDKYLLKYARAITDSEGIWYTARALK